MTRITGWLPVEEAPRDGTPVRGLIPATPTKQQSCRRVTWDDQIEAWYDSYGMPVTIAFYVPYVARKVR